MMTFDGIATSYGLWAMGGTILLLALFRLLRGRVRIEQGWGGFSIRRFRGIERLAHWLLAISVVALALTSLSLQYAAPDLDYGRTLPGRLLGEEVFAGILRIARALHWWVQLAFMAGLVLAFLLWVGHSLPHWRDAAWLVRGGGLIARGVHPPARKFNAGQKLLFWIVILCGAWVSGLIPRYEGYGTEWHGVPALVLICAVIVHIYMRTVGIQGAASAMTSGEVDANWARQHHSLWAESEVKRIEDAAEADAGDTVAARTP
jgi:formate dehydrogenase subunit gamma